MLFQVEMNVRLPHDLPAEKAEALKQTERARATRRRLAPSVASGPLRQRQIADPQEQNGVLSVCRSFRSWTCGSLRSVVSLHLSTTIIDTFRIN